ncbi:MAG: zinc ribbon domain-containing protein [Saprospiraceae bacterium]|nr:zinc ribbon domain-containing protein [Saprospiraceae bacterium]
MAMQLCPNCAADIIPGSKFCNRCGDKIAERTKTCPACQDESPLASVFCHHCGFHFEGRQRARERKYEPLYALDFDPGTLTEQVKALFFRSLRRRVEEEHNPEKYSDYVERFYQSRFREIYELRAEQIAEDALIQWERFGSEGLPEIDQRIDRAFEGLLDFFIIQYCPDINGVLLPPTILKYEKSLPGKTDLGAMIHDFLDFGHEQEVFYFDFISMRSDLLSNACKQFLYAERNEKVFFICDLSLKGTCKEGFALTDSGIYWRAPFDRARSCRYQELKEIKRQKDWITINGHFFTANPSLNLKLFKLLKKLRAWQQPAARTKSMAEAVV